MTEHLFSAIKVVSEILSAYYTYSFEKLAEINSFVMPACHKLGDHGQLLCDEDKDELFLALRFGTELERVFDQEAPQTHHVAVVAEEVSHFLMCADAAARNSSVSLLELEIQGEIDRFLCLLHWNSVAPLPLSLEMNFPNIQTLCEHVFQGPRFKNEGAELYIDAEAQAFLHLKRAFRNEWDNSFFDEKKFVSSARNYLNHLRSSVISKRSQWRVSA